MHISPQRPLPRPRWWSRAARLVGLVLVTTSVLALSQVRAQEPTEEPVQEPVQEDVTFLSGDLELAGTLTLPAGEGPHPAVVTISGSGPQNRDGEIPGVEGYRPFAEIAARLAEDGVAVLRYDDRGVGASDGDNASATSGDLALDAEAAVRFLQMRPEIDPLWIGLLGHSEGGLIAPYVAARHPGVAFVVALAPPVADSFEGLVTQQRRTLESAGLPPEVVQRHVAQTRTTLELTADEAWDELEWFLGEMVRGQLAALPAEQQEAFGDLEVAAEGLVAETMVQYRGWMRWFLAHDAAETWERLRVPALAVFGGQDVQVDLEQHRGALRDAADPELVTIATVPGANHLFLRAGTGSVTEYGSLEPTLMQELFEVLGAWLEEHVPN